MSSCPLPAAPGAPARGGASPQLLRIVVLEIPSQAPLQGVVRSQDSTERSWFKVSRLCCTSMKYSCDRRSGCTMYSVLEARGRVASLGSRKACSSHRSVLMGGVAALQGRQPPHRVRSCRAITSGGRGGSWRWQRHGRRRTNVDVGARVPHNVQTVQTLDHSIASQHSAAAAALAVPSWPSCRPLGYMYYLYDTG